MYALEAASGELRWKQWLGNGIRSSPVVADGLVYLSSTDDHLFALDAASGEERWRYLAGNSLPASSVVAQGVVYFGTWSHDSSKEYFFAMDAASGEKIRAYASIGSVSFSPVVADDVVYVGSSDSFLYAFPSALVTPLQAEAADPSTESEAEAASPELLWRFKAETAVSTPATVVDGVVYFGAADEEEEDSPKPGGLYAVDAADGELLWQHAPSPAAYSAPAVADGRLIYISADNRLIALDAATAEPLWGDDVVEGSLALSSRKPILDDGMTFILAENGDLDALDAASGQRLWRFNAGAGRFPPFTRARPG